jgi:hypothetical protein
LEAGECRTIRLNRGRNREPSAGNQQAIPPLSSANTFVKIFTGFQQELDYRIKCLLPESVILEYFPDIQEFKWKELSKKSQFYPVFRVSVIGCYVDFNYLYVKKKIKNSMNPICKGEYAFTYLLFKVHFSRLFPASPFREKLL